MCVCVRVCESVHRVTPKFGTALMGAGGTRRGVESSLCQGPEQSRTHVEILVTFYSNTCLIFNHVNAIPDAAAEPD